MTPDAALAVVEPRDDSEHVVAAIVERVAGARNGMTTPLHELADDSHSVKRIVTDVRAALGAAPEPGEWLTFPTVARLAATAAARARPSSRTVVRLTRNGSRTPFHCCHGIGGTVLFFAPVAARLRPDREFRALQAHGLDPANEPDRTVESMAARYVEDVVSGQPHGPYLLGGYSMGGVVAWEMADQMRSRGLEVVAVVILDSPARAAIASLDQLPSPFGLICRALGAPPLEPPAGRLDERVAWFHRELVAAGAVPRVFPVARLLRMVTLYDVHGRALLDYTPPTDSTIPVRLLTTQPPSVDAVAALGWAGVATRDISVRHVDADHFALMSEKHADAVATALQPWLDDVA